MAATMTRLGESREDRIFNGVIYAALALVFVSMVYPLWFILIASFSDPNSVYNGKVLLLPHNPTLRGYELILEYRPIWIGYRNAFLYLFVGTAINLAVMVPAAYALSRKDLVGRSIIMAVFVFTMFFGGGLIPTYLLVRKAGSLRHHLADGAAAGGLGVSDDHRAAPFSRPPSRRSCSPPPRSTAAAIASSSCWWFYRCRRRSLRCSPCSAA